MKKRQKINSHVITFTTFSFFFSTKQKFKCHNTSLFFTENIFFFSIRFHPPWLPQKNIITHTSNKEKKKTHQQKKEKKRKEKKR